MRSEERIARYRQMADEVRSKANRIADDNSRNVLLESGGDLERLAELESKKPLASAT
jgi:hypothetical protein